MSDPSNFPYKTILDIHYPPLQVVDVPDLVGANTHPWYNETLCQVNDAVVRLGVMQGEYHWHKHDNDDEFFFVLDGVFCIAWSNCSRARASWCRAAWCIARVRRNGP